MHENGKETKNKHTSLIAFGLVQILITIANIVHL